MKNIRYSFLIPFWNLEVWMLRRMLDSIPHRDDVEIILLDNASDATESEHISTMGDANVRVISQKERKSIGYCRNALIAQAQGDWLIFADADDRFITHELEQLMDMAETEDYDLIYWGLQQQFQDGTVANDSIGYFGTEIQPMTDKVYPMGHKYESPHKMVRRTLLLNHPEIRFDEIPIYEDMAYSVGLLLSTERIGVYPPMIYQYIRRDASTLGRTWAADVLMDVLQHVYSVLDAIKQNGYSILEQETTKGCLIRMKHASKWRFMRALLHELRLYGWSLFYRDLVGAGFETYETNLLKAIVNYTRVKIGAVLQTSR